MRAGSREAALVVAAAVLLATIMTWPLVIRGGSAGRIDSGDGQFSIWNVAWVARTLVVDPLGVYDANIFYPHRGTLAFSETNLGAGLIAVPFYWASGGNPYVAHNAVVFIAFVLAVTGTYSLARHLTGHRGGAAVAAVGFAFCPFVFAHTAHIQLLMTAGIPYSLLALHRFVEAHTAGRACLLGLALAAQGLSCGYYGVFAGLVVGYGVIFFGLSRGLWRRRAYWVWTSAAACVSVAVVLPLFWPYLELRQESGFTRTLADTRQWSATWASYLASSAWAHRWLLRFLPPWGEVLYPGTVAVTLGLTGAWIGLKRPAPIRGRDTVLFYATLAVVALWASFGPDAGLYAVLHEAVPLFSWLRAPSRLGLVVALALCVLTAFATQALATRSRRGVLVSAALAAAAVADLYVAPLRLFEARPPASAYDSLRKWPYGPVAEFPFFYERMDLPRHSEYMLNSTAHWRPLINGYSDYIPQDFRAMVVPLSSFPNPESFAILKRLRARYVVFHLHLYDHRAVEDLKARIEQYRDYLRPIRVEDPVWLFQIAAWPPEH